MRRQNRSLLDFLKALDRRAALDFSVVPPRLNARGLPAIILRDCLTGSNGRDKVDAWTPGYFVFPFRSYDRVDAISAQDRRTAIAAHFDN